jgi:hypothetical protein
MEVTNNCGNCDKYHTLNCPFRIMNTNKKQQCTAGINKETGVSYRNNFPYERQVELPYKRCNTCEKPRNSNKPRECSGCTLLKNHWRSETC